MLSKKHRLARREDFSTVFSRGSYAQWEGISIKFLKTDKPETRLGFPIGKNYSKKAVVRNRARRILHEAARVHIDSLKLGFDIVIMIRPDVKDLELKKTVDILQKIFHKANLFK